MKCDNKSALFEVRAMRRPPKPLWEEEEILTQALIEEFFSPLSEEELNRETSEEEYREFHFKWNMVEQEQRSKWKCLTSSRYDS